MKPTKIPLEPIPPLFKHGSRSFKNLSGQKINRWNVIGLEGRRKSRFGIYTYFWRCVCDCGNEGTVENSCLLRNKSRSCGCFRKEGVLRALKLRNTTHGMSETRPYGIWSSMIQRCNNPARSCYSRYGARGITVCDEWMSFEAFYADMGNPPSNLHTLERRDNDSGYNKDNCRWATRTEQARNTRKNVFITIGNETLCVAAWASIYGISQYTVYHRVHHGFKKDASLFAKRVRRRNPKGVFLSHVNLVTP